MPKTLLKEIEENSAMSLNFTITQNFIPTKFHVFREIGLANDMKADADELLLKELADIMTKNPVYANTIFIIQGGLKAWAANKFLSVCKFEKPVSVFRYKNRILPNNVELGKDFNSISHVASTVSDCINLGVLMGYKEIILCGVDLNNRLYFWQTHENKHMEMVTLQKSKMSDYSIDTNIIEQGRQTPHRSAQRLIKFVEKTRKTLERENVTLSVQNPDSLLSRAIPIYKISEKP